MSNVGGTGRSSGSTLHQNTIKTSGAVITSPGNGGAISNESNGLLYINHSTCTSNSAFDGGAIRGDSSSDGKIHIRSSTFTGNKALYGGASENFGNELRLDYDQFNTNAARNIGGALWSLCGPAFTNGGACTGHIAVATGGGVTSAGNQ